MRFTLVFLLIKFRSSQSLLACFSVGDPVSAQLGELYLDLYIYLSRFLPVFQCSRSCMNTYFKLASSLSYMLSPARRSSAPRGRARKLQGVCDNRQIGALTKDNS